MWFTWRGTLLLLGGSVATVAMATPYRYGTWLDQSATVLVAGVAVNCGTGLQAALVHIAKAAFVGMIVPVWRRSRSAGALCGILCLPLVLLSVWNSVALLALQRSARVTEARAAVEHGDRLRTELSAIGARLALVGWQPVATVEAEIAAERHNWLWDATTGCTKVMGAGQRQYCARVARLVGAREMASEAERLRTREAELRRELARQPLRSESRQPDLILLAAWFGISDDTAEIVRALLWAAVVEIVEFASFFFAGFFRQSEKERTTPTKSMQEPPSGTIRATAMQRQRRQPPRQVQVAKKSDGKNRGPCGLQGGCPLANPRSSLKDESDQQKAVNSFVATLPRGEGFRATGSALRDAYEQAREAQGWPKIPANRFGQHLRLAAEAAGGRKIKASRQFYSGVGLPAVV